MQTATHNAAKLKCFKFQLMVERKGVRILLAKKKQTSFFFREQSIEIQFKMTVPEQ